MPSYFSSSVKRNMRLFRNVLYVTVPFVGCVAGYAMPRQRNTRRTSCVPVPSSLVGAQRRCQTDTSIFSLCALHTDALRPSLAAISGAHLSQVGSAHLRMPAWSGDMVSLRLHPARRRLQPPPSPVVVILAASDPTYTAFYCWRSCVSGGWKPPLEQSATRRHLSSNDDCFAEPPRNLSLFPIISLLTVFDF